MAKTLKDRYKMKMSNMNRTIKGFGNAVKEVAKAGTRVVSGAFNPNRATKGVMKNIDKELTEKEAVQAERMNDMKNRYKMPKGNYK